MKTVEDLQRDMAAIRRDLPEHVEDVVERARALADWRYYIRHYPWLSLGVAAALGYLLVPQRRRVIRLDADTIAEWADRNGVDWGKAKRSGRGGGVTQRLLETAARAAVGAGAGYLGRQLNNLLNNGPERP
jgi:hypothetical protein